MLCHSLVSAWDDITELMASGGNTPEITTNCRGFAFGEEVAKQ